MFSHSRLQNSATTSRGYFEMSFNSLQLLKVLLNLNVFTEIPHQRHWVKSIHEWETEDVKDGSDLDKEKQKGANDLCWERQKEHVWHQDAKCMVISSLCHANLAYLTLWRFQFISGNNIDEKIKLIKFCNCHGDVIPLEQRKGSVKNYPGEERPWPPHPPHYKKKPWHQSQIEYPGPSL